MGCASFLPNRCCSLQGDIADLYNSGDPDAARCTAVRARLGLHSSLPGPPGPPGLPAVFIKNSTQEVGINQSVPCGQTEPVNSGFSLRVGAEIERERASKQVYE